MTHAQYLAHEAKIRAGRSGTVASVASEGPESELQQAIIAECSRRGWICLHGSMTHRTFRTPGEWDFTVLGDKGRVWFLEIKNKVGKLSPDQRAIHAWAYKLGHSVHVVRSFEGFIAVCDADRILNGTAQTKDT